MPNPLDDDDYDGNDDQIADLKELVGDLAGSLRDMVTYLAVRAGDYHPQDPRCQALDKARAVLAKVREL